MYIVSWGGGIRVYGLQKTIAYSFRFWGEHIKVEVTFFEEIYCVLEILKTSVF